jgi:hypothetical protein
MISTRNIVSFTNLFQVLEMFEVRKRKTIKDFPFKHFIIMVSMEQRHDKLRKPLLNGTEWDYNTVMVHCVMVDCVMVH